MRREQHLSQIDDFVLERKYFKDNEYYMRTEVVSDMTLNQGGKYIKLHKTFQGFVKIDF